MEISTFKVKVQKAVSEVLGQEYTVELREVQKNNGVLLQGLMIRKGQDNVTPTIYLNSFWEAYEGGVTFADIIKKIISIYKEDGIGRKIDVSFFQDFEKVKEKLCFRLVNREKNQMINAGIDLQMFDGYLGLSLQSGKTHQARVPGHCCRNHQRPNP